MTDAEKIADLQSAIRRADGVLEWILGEPGHPEWMLTTAKRVRRILRASLKRTGGRPEACTDEAGSASLAGGLPRVKLGKRAISSMIEDGIIKPAGRRGLK